MPLTLDCDSQQYTTGVQGVASYDKLAEHGCTDRTCTVIAARICVVLSPLLVDGVTT